MKKILINPAPSHGASNPAGMVYPKPTHIHRKLRGILGRCWVKIILSLCLFLALTSVAKAAALGDQVHFSVDSSYDASGRTSLIATLQEISDKAYFYTEDYWWWNNVASQDAIRAGIHQLATEFDQKIYPEMTKSYGSIWEPGIDNDARVTILITVMKQGAGGYFDSADEYPKSISPSSNEREMLYVSALYFNTPRAKSFLAHEFQHLITFYQKEKLYSSMEEVWLNEARSEYAATLLGYDDEFASSNLEKRIFDFFKNPSDSLTEWGNTTNDYGSVNLFMQYLAEHYGDQIFSRMTQGPLVGIESIDDALKSLNAKENFSDVFMDWVITNYLNDCQISSQKYCYLNPNLRENLRALPTIEENFSADSPGKTDFVIDWSGHWYQIDGIKGDFKIEFQGEADDNFRVAYLIKRKSAGYEINFLSLDSSEHGFVSVDDSNNTIELIVLIPVSQKKTSGFLSGAAEPFHGFSYKVSAIQNKPAVENPPIQTLVPPNFPDGSLISAAGDTKVYIIEKGYRRWIQTPQIFNSYLNLKWENIIEVTQQELNSYQESFLVRADGDTKVYEINGDGTKHWLNMTAEQFSQSGRKWDMVYIINKAERDIYVTGGNVLFR